MADEKSDPEQHYQRQSIFDKDPKGGRKSYSEQHHQNQSVFDTYSSQAVYSDESKTNSILAVTMLIFLVAIAIYYSLFAFPSSGYDVVSEPQDGHVITESPSLHETFTLRYNRINREFTVNTVPSDLTLSIVPDQKYPNDWWLWITVVKADDGTVVYDNCFGKGGEAKTDDKQKIFRVGTYETSIYGNLAAVTIDVSDATGKQ